MHKWCGTVFLCVEERVLQRLIGRNYSTNPLLQRRRRASSFCIRWSPWARPSECASLEAALKKKRDHLEVKSRFANIKKGVTRNLKLYHFNRKSDCKRFYKNVTRCESATDKWNSNFGRLCKICRTFREYTIEFYKWNLRKNHAFFNLVFSFALHTKGRFKVYFWKNSFFRNLKKSWFLRALFQNYLCDVCIRS